VGGREGTLTGLEVLEEPHGVGSQTTTVDGERGEGDLAGRRGRAVVVG
jgi:hypothetical protein